MARAIQSQVLTANRLGDGRVVYLAFDGWTSNLDDARVLSDEGASETAEREGREAVAARQVVDPYLIEVTADAFRIEPVRLRERIRATGPTTGNSYSAVASAALAAGVSL